MCGWNGVILRIDLTKRKVVKQTLPAEWARKFIGGRGINSWILYNEVPPGVKPYDPENRLIFGTGPLTGTAAPSSGRFTVTAKSPLTDILGDANCGGFFGPELKHSGYDHMVIHGRCRRPTYLWIHNDEIEFRDASALWGRDTWESQETIKDELGDDRVKIACIGQAGEKMVRFASIITGLNHAAARTGMGAVMGAKNLKAVAVRGTRRVRVAREEDFKKICTRLNTLIRNSPVYQTFRTFGTLFLVELCAESGSLPVMNFQTSVFPEAREIGAESFVKRYKVGSSPCYGCSVACSHIFKVKEGPYAGISGGGPDYEIVAALGSRCGVTDLPAILKMNDQCNKLGIDATSTGAVISLIMELFQRKIIDENDTGGVPFKWGDHGVMIDVIPMIANRKGIGDLLAEGVYRISRTIGKGAENYALHQKKLETNTEMRVNKGFQLAFSVSTRGADHLRGLPTICTEQNSLTSKLGERLFGTPQVSDPFTYDGKAQATIWYENLLAIADAAEVCKFVTFWQNMPICFTELAELIAAATSLDITGKELEKVGERIVNVERMYNLREGIGREDDYPTGRFMGEPLSDGPRKGMSIVRQEYDKALDAYYELRGWHRKNGVPTDDKLGELGLASRST